MILLITIKRNVKNISNWWFRLYWVTYCTRGHWAVFHQIDLSKAEQVLNLPSIEHDISGIIHFAAFKAVGESVANP
jgi:UDP-glucose 4-epimerase